MCTAEAEEMIIKVVIWFVETWMVVIMAFLCSTIDSKVIVVKAIISSAKALGTAIKAVLSVAKEVIV